MFQVLVSLSPFVLFLDYHGEHTGGKLAHSPGCTITFNLFRSVHETNIFITIFNVKK